jgi:hypothetical protein
MHAFSFRSDVYAIAAMGDNTHYQYRVVIARGGEAAEGNNFFIW